MSTSATQGRNALVAVALVTVLLIGQWAAVSAAPESGVASTGRVLGRTGFAYLGGIRTFAAAALWNRLDPQFDGYYGGSLNNAEFMMPTMRLVVALDPQFTQAYQVSSYFIFRMGDATQGVEIAREGVVNNPRSGIMRANLVQLLLLHDKAGNRDEIHENIRAGLLPASTWANEDEEFEGLAVMRGTLVSLGVSDGVSGIETRLSELRTHGTEIGDHDHDGDGKQDH